MQDDPSSDISEIEVLPELHPSAGTRIHWFRWIFRVGVIALVALGILYWKSNKKEVPVQYLTEVVRRGNLVVTVTATGNLEPTNQVQVSSEQSGIVESVETDINDVVEVGQVLARLDTTKIKAQLQQAKAVLESAKAQMLSAHATVSETHTKLTRLTELHRISLSKAISENDLEAAQAALDRALADEAKAKAAVSQAEASLEAYETDLSKMVIRSPINGVVLTRSVDTGQTVAASLQAPELFVLAEDLARMQLHVDVDEADVGVVTAGQEATFTVDAYPDRKYPTKIRRISYGSETTNNVVTYKTVLDVDNFDLSLRPGMTATATITVKKIENAILAPNTALRFTPPQEKQTQANNGGLVSRILPHPPSSPAKTKTTTNGNDKSQVVWRVDNGGLVCVPVTTGLTDGTMTEILEGELMPDTQLAVDTLKAVQ